MKTRILFNQNCDPYSSIGRDIGLAAVVVDFHFTKIRMSKEFDQIKQLIEDAKTEWQRKSEIINLNVDNWNNADVNENDFHPKLSKVQ